VRVPSEVELKESAIVRRISETLLSSLLFLRLCISRFILSSKNAESQTTSCTQYRVAQRELVRGGDRPRGGCDLCYIRASECGRRDIEVEIFKLESQEKRGGTGMCFRLVPTVIG
jgi:hypothetical protein